MARWCIPLFAVLFIVLLSSSVALQRTGFIIGTVVTPNGDPVQDAHVSAEVMDGEKIVTVLATQTDDHGTFSFTGLALGKYRVYAEKRESGYLSTRRDIFSFRPDITAVLSETSPTFNSVIRFDPKAGIISGWVRDATSGRSIPAHFSLAPVSVRGGWSTTGTAGDVEFRLQIPSNTEIRFGACSEGYKRWIYANPSDSSQISSIKLKPESELELEIKLEPSTDPDDARCLFGKF